MNDQAVADVLMLLSNRLAEVESAQEEILRSQARLLAAIEQRPLDQVYDEMKRRVRDGAADYRARAASEINQQRARDRKADQN